MKKIMIRLLLLASLLSNMMTVAYAETAIPNDPDCFARLEKDKCINDFVTLTTVDSTIIQGLKPIVNHSMSFLYFRGLTESSIGESALVPFNQVREITYRKPGPQRKALTILGLIIGGSAGVIIGNSLGSGEKNKSVFWGSFGFGEEVTGAVIGGLLGAAVGHSIGSRMTVKVTLNCR